MTHGMVDELWRIAMVRQGEEYRAGRGRAPLYVFAEVLRAAVRRQALQDAAYVLAERGDDVAAAAVRALLAEDAP